MADLDQIAKAFRLFNEKAEKLARLSFMEKMNQPDVGVTITFENLKSGGSSVIQQRRGPREEETDAFVLTFRFFIQDNEETSFRKMEQHYLAAPINHALKQRFVDLRRDINHYLDETVGINENGEELTNRKIMDVFIYGGLSHANEEKRRIYLSWINDRFLSQLKEHFFVSTLAAIHTAIALIKNMNEEALKQLPGPDAQSAGLSSKT